MIRRCYRSFFFGIFLCLLLLNGCGADTLDTIKERGVLYIGMDPSYVPFEALAPDGELYGLDVDLSNELADRLGVKAEFVFIGYDGLYSALEIEQVDILISGLVIEPVRMDDVGYSDSYFDAGLVLVTGESETGEIREMADMEFKTIAVEVAAEGDAEARRWSRRLHGLDVLPLSTAEDALRAVLEGNADATLVGGIEARLFIRDNPSLAIASKPLTNELYAVAVRMDDKDLLSAINKKLDSMDDDGSMESIITRWF
ncbi:MAG: amino acid ABC transporter substrate-binding protein [Anaerolineales bacterium]|nr:amino acid ABC transporter substrate-binding protein [Anaerolineales bacterium]